MKQKKLPLNLLLKFIIPVLLPLNLFAQNLVGIWTGKIYTTEKTLPYEVVISEKDGKLSGYSYTTFTVKGEEMVAMKSLVVTKDKDNNIIMEDIDLVFNSFDEESPKQLKQTNTLELEIVNDKTMLLIGKFKTFKTEKFRSMTGGIRLRKDSIVEQPKLIAKLDEMDLKKSVSFLAPPPPQEETIAKVEKNVTEIEKPKPVEKEVAAPTTAKATAPVIKTAAKPIKPASPPVATAKPPVTSAAKPPVAVNTPGKPVARPPAVTAKPTPAPTTTAPVVKAEPKPEVKKVASRPLSAFLGDRAIENIQTVVFKSDSLVLTLYDNGEVDGDTVSVLLNGKMIISKQGLSTRPISKTIYMTPDMGDSSQLIMYAESLGTIPPNTGLLIVKDGRDRYEIRFAGDLKKNAAIILKRKELN